MLPQQFAITEVCWKEWKNHFIGAFIIVLTITAVTLNTFLTSIRHSDIHTFSSILSGKPRYLIIQKKSVATVVYIHSSFIDHDQTIKI
jgi:hypothetical protein